MGSRALPRVLARSPGIAWTRQVPLLALAGATSETTAQITTAALSTILFTGASQPSAVRLTRAVLANPTTTRHRMVTPDHSPAFSVTKRPSVHVDSAVKPNPRIARVYPSGHRRVRAVPGSAEG